MSFSNDHYTRFRNNRFLHLFVVNLRYIIGLGFLPSGMVKIMDRPFTRIENVGVFFDFLDALYATGFYYNMIGIMQVLAAVLLITQRYATLGAFIFLPVIFNISVLTLSTIGSLTPLLATLMLCGIIFLLLWDYPKWMNIFNLDNSLKALPAAKNFPTFTKIQMWTGILLILLPSFLISIDFGKTGVAFVGAVLIGGNLVSEWKHPVLRPLIKKIIGKSTTSTEVQKS